MADFFTRLGKTIQGQPGGFDLNPLTGPAGTTNVRPRPESNTGITVGDVQPGSFLYYDGNGVQQVSGNVLGTSATAQPSGPSQAEIQAQRERQNNIQTIGTARDQIIGSGRQAFDSIFNRFDTGARSLVDNVRTGQQNIDRSRQNIELEKLNSLSGLSSQIRQGIQSGNVRLAANNAADSSGSQQLARAYQSIGTQQGNAIFNEAALGNRDLNFDQDALDLQAAEGLRQLEVYKEEEKNRVGADVENKLLALDEQARGLGLNGQVEVQQIKQQIIDEGIAKLIQIDQFIKQGLASVKPQSQDAIQAEAQQLRTAGRPSGGFNFGNLTQSGPANTGFQIPLLGARREER